MKKLSVLRMVSLGAVFALAFGVMCFTSVQQADAAMYAVNMLEGGGGGGSSTNTSTNTSSSPSPTYYSNGICY